MRKIVSACLECSYPCFRRERERGRESAPLLYAVLGENFLLKNGFHEQAAGDALVQGEALGLVARCINFNRKTPLYIGGKH